MIKTTGWPPSALMQDDCKALSKWLAKRACCICWKRKVKEASHDTQPLVPTDPELMDLGHECELDAITFGREVLARWGQHAHSGEPVATVIKRGASRDWMSERLGGLPDGVYSLYTAPQPSPVVQGDELDAARWHWIAEYLVGPRTDLDDEIVASETVDDLRNLVDAARAAQEGK